MTLKTRVIMLKIRLCFTGINYILNYNLNYYNISQLFFFIIFILFYFFDQINAALMIIMALFHCMVRFGTVHFWGGGFHRVQYLVLFLVPPRPRFQENRTVTKTWRVNSADHWLARENRHCLRHWTCGTRHNRPARFKSVQPAKGRTQLFWMSVPFF